ncbi:O-antigen polymerase [Pseudoalteromonas sp. APC 3356]|nr:O-antigen polymerase [Pseudoalteromonas sp. APC 3356]
MNTPLIELCLLFFIASHSIISNRMLSPLMIFSSIWLTGVLIFNLSGSLYNVSLIGRGYIIGFVFINIFFEVFSYKIVEKEHLLQVSSKPFQLSNKKVFYYLIYSSFFLSFIYIYPYYVESLNYESLSNYFYYSRVADKSGTPLVAHPILFQQLPPLMFCMSLLMYIFYCQKTVFNKSKGGIIFLYSYLLLSMSLLLVSGTRSTTFIFIISLIAIYINASRGNVLKKIIRSILIFLCLFMVLTILMRVTNQEKENGLVLFTLLNHIIIYIFGGIKSFDIFLQGGIGIGSEVYQSLLSISPTNIMPYVSIGEDLETNVFSVFSVYFYYFGEFIGMVLLAFISSICYFFYTFRYVSILFFSTWILLTSCLVLSVFHDYFSVVFPYLIRVVLLASVFSSWQFKIHKFKF